ncbi:MAG: DNA-protecting protein DprA [Actinomycetota bacterium]|nr:DNA-protecting protein DprA [Actinomycetota bacterium]
MRRSEQPERVLAGAALLSLVGPSRLDAVLARWPDPAVALRALGAQAPPGLTATLAGRDTRVLLASDADFPIPEDLPQRPPLLLIEGDRAGAFEAPRVAVVGTRAATPHGLADARRLGAFLTAAGITVVSGMAIGIDGEAHLGALSVSEADGGPAGPVGVLATGLDVVYPRRHQTLFARVRRSGLLVSECAFGTEPAPGRFPVRNRIIAALADVVVVVEATLKGGSRITAERALDYGRPVLAIPGSRRNPSAAGCNALLADGAHPLLDPSDVLVALGITPGARRGWSATAPKRAMSSLAAGIKRALGGEPAHPDDLVARTGFSPEEVAVAIEELVAAGSAERSRGFVWPV